MQKQQQRGDGRRVEREAPPAGASWEAERRSHFKSRQGLEGFILFHLKKTRAHSATSRSATTWAEGQGGQTKREKSHPLAAAWTGQKERNLDDRQQLIKRLSQTLRNSSAELGLARDTRPTALDEPGAFKYQPGQRGRGTWQTQLLHNVALLSDFKQRTNRRGKVQIPSEVQRTHAANRDPAHLFRGVGGGRSEAMRVSARSQK